MSGTVKKTEYPFSASELRTVCAAYAAEQVAITAEVQNAFSPSEAHAAAIEYLVKHSQKKAGRRDFFLKFAAAAAAFVIIFSTVLATNVHAREAFVNWIRQIFPDHVLYLFSETDTERKFRCTIGWIPDGFTMTESGEDVDESYYIFENDGKGFIIECCGLSKYDILDIDDYDSIEDVKIGCKPASLYMNSDTGINVLIIVDESKQLIVSINGTLDRKALINLGESINYK